MNNNLFLPLFIAVCHIPIFLLQFPDQKLAKKVQPKIAVHTIHLMEEGPPSTSLSTMKAAAPPPTSKPKEVTKKQVKPKPKVVAKKQVRPKPKPKKKRIIATKKTPAKKTPPTQKKKNLQKALSKTLNSKQPRNKQVATAQNKNGSSGKKTIKKDAGKEQTEYNQYLQTVVLALQECLTLPEAGKVKLAITVSEQGKIIKIVSLLAESENNLEYLKENLTKIALPSYAKKENRTFTIVFCDEK